MDINGEALSAACIPRKYAHFDAPLPRAAIRRLVTDSERVSRHAFLPFLHFTMSRNRFKRRPGGVLEKSKKEREICFAAHADASIYAYYSVQLSSRYETAIAEAGLVKNVIAFRRLGRSNVDLAFEAFDWISNNRPCVAVGMDVKDFFGSLDHASLKSAWCAVLGIATLPKDHYAVFRSVTKYAWVDLNKALASLKMTRSQYRHARAKRICSIEAFRSVVREGDLIRSNNASKGIPQGSPISALLSNIYMFEFDRVVSSIVESCGGLYRRYCDDILIVVRPELVDDVKARINSELLSLHLTSHHEKELTCAFPEDGLADRPLQYLGLVFDGQHIRLRGAGVARYYSKMRSGIGQLRRSSAAGRPKVEIRRAALYRQYTDRSGPNGRSFPAYALRAAKTTQSKAIARQIRRHMARFNAWTRPKT
ncbi:antiviral reverse transcriptase Drt2 [Luteibacter jiangsuensis]